ncbi:MAG: fimbrillin family protein [Alistipes sp.]|nr:fimbrillin family protein [Alistipes sp.]
MKKFFIAIVALAVAVSCSNDDIISIDRQAIGFGNPFVENSVRADYSDGQELTQFNVYGTVTGTAGTVNIFAGVPVTGTVGAAEWSYAEQYNQYWIPGAAYNFAAVVDATVATSDAADTIGMPTTLTTTADDNGNLNDMLYATASVASAVANQGVVGLTFAHMLSKVHFTVTSNATGGYHHNVTNITVANFESGTYTIDGGTWAGTTAKPVAFANIENVTVNNTNGVSNADLLLVPNAATFIVTFTVDLYKNGTKLGTETKTVAVENDLVKGNSYNFTIECSVGNPIKFTVTNDPTWTDQPDVTVQ